MQEIKKCEKCQTELFTHFGEFDFYGFCPQCIEIKSFSKYFEKCCPKPNQHPVKVIVTGNRIQVRKQCKNCGYSGGNSLKMADFDLNILPIRDDELEQKYNLIASQERSEFNDVFEKFRTENYTIENKHPGYNDYINSEDWKKKRIVVLNRDKHICQSCLSEVATQVHHLNYKHLFNEPLFDLVSVCKRCHDIITKIDKRLEADKILIAKK